MVFSRSGSTSQMVNVRKEVIVSAGVIGSAQLLMLSGIGPSQHLADLKVCVCVCVCARAKVQNFTFCSICSVLELLHVLLVII